MENKKKCKIEKLKSARIDIFRKLKKYYLEDFIESIDNYR